MKCPVESADLASRSIKGLKVDYCPQCLGVFVPLGQVGFPALCSSEIRPSEREEILLPQDGSRPSPFDGKPMRVFHYRGVEIDYCPGSDSVWLDAGELEKLVHLAKPQPPASSKGLSRDWRHNPFIDGIDAALTSIDVLDLLGEAIGALFDAW
jgi:Zn-finger nucleic acid-binding protein